MIPNACGTASISALSSKARTATSLALVQNHALFEQLLQEGYDVGFVEQYDACGLGLLRYVGVKSLFWLSATGVYRLQTDAKGIHYPLSYVPGKGLKLGEACFDRARFSELFSALNDQMSLLQRVENVLLAAVSSNGGVATWYGWAPLESEVRSDSNVRNRSRFQQLADIRCRS